MRDAGYEVTTFDGGTGLDGKLAPGFDLQSWKCAARYPEAHSFLPFNADGVRIEYEYLTEYVVPCAEALGIEFTGEIPSKETWALAWHDRKRAPEAAHWDPTRYIRITGGERASTTTPNSQKSSTSSSQTAPLYPLVNTSPLMSD